jgi:hypothetical protein
MNNYNYGNQNTTPQTTANENLDDLFGGYKASNFAQKETQPTTLTGTPPQYTYAQPAYASSMAMQPTAPEEDLFGGYNAGAGAAPDNTNDTYASSSYQQQNSQQYYPQQVALTQYQDPLVNAMQGMHVGHTPALAHCIPPTSVGLSENIQQQQQQISIKRKEFILQKNKTREADPVQKEDLAKLDMQIYSMQKYLLADIDNQIHKVRASKGMIMPKKQFEQLIVARYNLKSDMVPYVDYVQNAIINDDPIILNEFDKQIARALETYTTTAAVYDNKQQASVKVKFKTSYSGPMDASVLLLTALGKSTKVIEVVGAGLMPGLAIVTKVISATALKVSQSIYEAKEAALNECFGDFKSDQASIVSTIARSCTFVFAQMLNVIEAQILLASYNDPSIKCDQHSIIKTLEKELQRSYKTPASSRIKAGLGRKSNESYNFIENFAFLVSDKILSSIAKESKNHSIKNNPKYLVKVGVDEFTNMLRWRSGGEVVKALPSSHHASVAAAINNLDRLGIKANHKSNNLICYGTGTAPSHWHNHI